MNNLLLPKRYFVLLLVINLLLFSVHLPAQGKLAIIIDDIGYNLKQGRQLTEMQIPLTLAVLPFTPHGAQLAELGHQQGKEIMLHIPMSNEHNLALGPGALTTEITHTKLIATLNKNLDNIPHVKGLNNHMGSQLTQDAKTMGWLMGYLKKHQLYFIDSRTTAKTQALNQAQALGLSSSKRDVFLDNNTDPEHINRQLNLAIQYARKRGTAIAIGHPYPSTISVLRQAKSLAQLQGVELVVVSDLLSQEIPIDVYSPNYCPAEIPAAKSIFVTEPLLKMPTHSHKKFLFVIKKI